MNWLFLAFVVSVVGGGIHTFRRIRKPAERTRQSAVPGYTVTGGAEFGIDPEVGLIKGEDWSAETIETFHSRNRSRVVIRLLTKPSLSPTDLRELLGECAREVAERSRARVVLIEAGPAGEPDTALLWAPDGMGWDGVEARREVFVGPGAA